MPPRVEDVEPEAAELPLAGPAETAPDVAASEREERVPKRLRSWVASVFRGAGRNPEGPAPAELVEEPEPVAESPVASEAREEEVGEEQPDRAKREIEEPGVPPAEEPPALPPAEPHAEEDVTVPPPEEPAPAPEEETPRIEAPAEPPADQREPPRRLPPPRAVPPTSPRLRPSAPVVPRQAVPHRAPVTAFPARPNQPREWNLWDLERLARDENRRSPERAQEWSYLFLNLRQFAAPGGTLPAEFDGLIRESFGPLLARIEQT